MRGHERDETQQHECLTDRTREHQPDDPEAERDRAAEGRRLRCAGDEQGDERERGREQRVTRELVEEEYVAGVREQGDHRRDRRVRAILPRHAEPRDEREGVEHRKAHLGDERPALEERPDDERRARRPLEDRHREDDVGVEELRVREEVAGQVATRLQR